MIKYNPKVGSFFDGHMHVWRCEASVFSISTLSFLSHTGVYENVVNISYNTKIVTRNGVTSYERQNKSEQNKIIVHVKTMPKISLLMVKSRHINISCTYCIALTYTIVLLRMCAFLTYF